MRTLAGLLNQKSPSIDAAKGTTEVWILQFAYHRSSNRRRTSTFAACMSFRKNRGESNRLPRLTGGLSEFWKSARLVQQGSCPTSHCKSTIEHYPSGSVVARVFLTANPSVYTPVHESVAYCWREKEMIQPHPLV
jgi:hypothetical protein